MTISALSLGLSLHWLLVGSAYVPLNRKGGVLGPRGSSGQWRAKE